MTFDRAYMDPTEEEEEAFKEMSSALDVQVGGGHYKGFVIQPAEFCEANGIGFLPGCVIKRLCRWESKDGLKDLEKAKHEIDLMIAIRKKYGRLPS